MPVYAKPYTGQFLDTFRELKFNELNGMVRVFEDKQRPTPDHICSPDGTWILPPKNKESVAQERAKRYVSETDELKRHIESDLLLGKPPEETEPKIREWREKVNKIKQELPYPTESAMVQTYYQPVK